MANDGRTVCKNTLDVRIQQSYDRLLPAIRGLLFLETERDRKHAFESVHNRRLAKMQKEEEEEEARQEQERLERLAAKKKAKLLEKQ